MQKECNHCHKIFETEHSKQEYCSAKCCSLANKYKRLPESGKRICEYCGKEYYYEKGQPNWQKNNQTVGKGIKADRFCSYECGMNYRKQNSEQTCLKKYGVKNAGGSKESIKKIKENRKKHIEIDKEYQAKINEKRKQTNVKKYGVEYTIQNEDKKLKMKQTNLEKYGTEYFSQTNICKKKVKNTIKKHKLENQKYQQEITNKINNTNLKKYGVKRFGASEKFKIYIKEKWKNKTKEELQIINKKRKQTCLEKYNNENYRGREKINWTEVITKGFETKKKNGSLHTSKGENELTSFIKNLGFNPTKYMIGNNHSAKRFEIDIYIPELQIGIEYNGIYYHSKEGPNEKGSINYHYNKALLAKEKGIDLIQIWEDQWQNQQELIKTILKTRLQKLDNTQHIYARNCKIKEISGKIYKDFCIKNHIQGYRQAKVKLGLFYNDELVQIASFNKIKNLGKQNRTEEWEWIRGCPASNNIVVGGTSKLFKYFIKNYNPNSVLCYADWNLFNGQGYKQCGFIFDGYTGPNKFYITNTISKIRINRNPYKYKILKDLCIKNKLYTCYGAGSLRYIWKKEN